MKIKSISLLITSCLVILAIFACASGGDSAGHHIVDEPSNDIEVFPQLAYSLMVYSVAFSPDGKQMVSGCSNVRLWDVETGREIRTFLGHTNAVLSVAFSPDGKQVLSGSNDLTIKLWDVETGQEIWTFMGHTDILLSVAFSPDGKQALSGSRDGAVKLWNTATGREIRTFSGHTKRVDSVAFSPDGTQALSGSEDETMKLWNIATGHEIRTFSKTDWRLHYFKSVAFSPDGKQILSNLGDHIKLWDVATGREIKTIFDSLGSGGHYNFNSAVFSPDGKQILAGSSFGNSTMVLWDVATGREIKNISVDTDFIWSVAFSPDGKQALSGTGSYDVFINNSVKLWDLETGREIRTFSGYSGNVRSVAFSPDGMQILSGGAVPSSFQNNTVMKWDALTGRKIRTFLGHTSFITSVDFSPDGKQALSGSSDKTIKLWDAETGMEIRTFLGHSGRITSLSFSPDGKQVLSGSEDKTMKLWDAETGSEIKTFLGHTGYITSLSFSPDGKQALSGGSEDINDNTVKLWNIETGREIKTFLGHSDRVNSVAFSPDGKQALSGSRDNTAKLWDIETGKEIKTFSVYSVWSVAFNGVQALTGSLDGTVKLWDTHTGREIRTLSGHSGRVTSLSFSPDGKQALSGSFDGIVKLWDVSSGNEIASFISFSGTDTMTTTASRGLTVETETAAASIDGEWLSITPDGYFNASPRGDRFINVRINNTVTGIDSFRSTFYNPDAVEARLQGRPDPASRNTIQQAAAFIPPTVTIQSPANFSTTRTATANLSVAITSQSLPVTNIRVFINGRPVGRNELAAIKGEGLQAERTSLTVTGNQRTVNFTMPVELDPGENRIEVIAFNGFSENRRHVDVTWNAPAGQRPPLPNLWILAVGVNRYDNAGQRLGGMGNLNYAAADAKRLVETLKAQEGRRYAKVNSLLIGDGESLLPTSENIRRSLAFLDQAGDRDIVILFLAGHGVSAQDRRFFFLPRDAVVSESAGNFRVDESRAISAEEITAVLEGSGNRLLFIDACHSGGVDNNRMIRAMMESNAFVFAASQGNELSYEDARWGGGHGVFTYNILNALRGAPAAMAENNVSVRSMSGFVSLEVPRMTDNRQNPRAHSLLFADFPLAVIRQ